MKNQNRISQLTLELYHRGLATNKERRLVEEALVTDSEVRKRYEALQESDHEIRRLVNQELKRLNVPERPPVGANVSIEDNAIPGKFAGLYNAGGKAAGTYTRPDIHSEAWIKK